MQLRLVASKSAFDYLRATRDYLDTHGTPVASYSNKHSIFRVNRRAAAGGAWRGEPGSPDRCSLGCRVEADSDLGAIGDVHLIARLQALCEGLHSRILHVDSVGHAVRAGKGDSASVVCCGDDGYARGSGNATSIRGLRPAGADRWRARRCHPYGNRIVNGNGKSVAGFNSSEVGNIRPSDDRGLPSVRCPQHHYRGWSCPPKRR